MHVIGHGIDLVEISRIARMLDEHGERFIDRCFTDEERTYAEQAARRRVERYAVRFACKEAAMKALGTGWRFGIAWRDIGVSRRSSGQPALIVTGRFAEAAAALNITEWHVSLSHTPGAAIASVIACGDG